jgi:tetratricopeptide (TPR) repeat protein
MMEMNSRLRKLAVRMIVTLVCMWALGVSAAANWSMDIPIPNNDPQWEKVKALWANHYDAKNLDELIAALTPLKDKYPDRVEPALWLAEVNYMHGRKIREGREKYYAEAEKLSAQVAKQDPKNTLAIRILFDTLGYSRDREYIFKNYGALLKAAAPLPDAQAVPDMKPSPEWDAFKKIWDQRVDIEKAKAAVPLIEKIADSHPNDGLAQTWASYANYFCGEYYTGQNQHDSKAMPYYKKGISYGEKAMKLSPHSVPANYWYQNNLARAIQFTSFMNQARYLMDILRPLLFCSYENNSYHYFDPVLTLATMITNGGWVTEKGMGIAGITLDMEMNSLEIAEILCPTFYYIPYARADVLSTKGKNKEALEILEKLLAKNPDIDPMIPDNRTYLNLARLLQNDIKSGKR